MTRPSRPAATGSTVPASASAGLPLALIIALVGIVLFALDVAAARAGLLARPAAAVGGTALLGLLGLVALVLALRALFRHRRRFSSSLSFILSLGMLGFPLYFLFLGLTHPAIHDISTDLAQPPAFAALRAVRAAVGATPLHRDASIAAAQAKAYPDLHALILDQPPAKAFIAALEAARAMGWQIALGDPGAGRIEATATTPLFHFRDDVVIRIRQVAGNAARSRIDVRSASRQGLGDFGANAARIRAYLARLHQP